MIDLDGFLWAIIGFLSGIIFCCSLCMLLISGNSAQRRIVHRSVTRVSDDSESISWRADREKKA